MSGAATVYEAAEARRVWSIDLGLLTDAEGVALRQLLDPLYGRRALTWAYISTHASATNMLTPRQVAFAAGTWNAGSALRLADVRTADGTAFAGLQLVNAGASVVFAKHPAIPGRAHTFSVYGHSRTSITQTVLAVVWHDSAGTALRTDTAGAIRNGAVLERVVLSNVTPPSGAVTYELHLQGGDVFAWPAVTLSSTALPFALGGGCADVTADIPGVQLLQAWPDRAPLTSATLTVREL